MALPGFTSACSSAAVSSIRVFPNLLPENTTLRLAGERRISAAAGFRWRVATTIGVVIQQVGGVMWAGLLRWRPRHRPCSGSAQLTELEG